MNNIHPLMAAALAPFAPPQSEVQKKTKRPKGRSFDTVLGDDIPITVFYDYQPPEAAVYDLDSPMCGPGCPADVDICEVMLMGEDVRDLLADHVIERLGEQALERHES